ncbi:MAG: hypothetical protein RR425_01970 [Erysipelotrichales bacterium]
MKNTEELENSILENPQIIEEIPSNIISAKTLLNQLANDKGYTGADFQRKLGASSSIYEILSFKSTKKTRRESLLAILITLECDLETINRVLQLFSHSKIYAKNKFDAIIYYCINNNLDIDNTNDYLIKNNFEPLTLSKK